MTKHWEDVDTRTKRAQMAFHGERISGHINMLDSPMPYDPEGTVVAVIIDVKRERVIRCALSRAQAKNLATKLMECM